MTLKMVVGCGLAIGGFCIYSHAKMYAKAQPQTHSAADLEAQQRKVQTFVSLALSILPTPEAAG